MIDFPENEIQTYRFTLRNTHYMVEAAFGNNDVFAAHADDYLPNVNSGAWSLMDETDLEYWIGIVYAYKMTDDVTCNVYSSQDYRIMGAVCQMLDQVPEFDALEKIIGYSVLAGCSEYADWSSRAKEWLERERRWNIPAFPNPLAEGAD